MAYTLYASDGAGKPPAGYIRRSADVRALGTSAIPLNAWTHLASTYDGANLRVYVNGVLAGTTAVTGAIGGTANPLRIGGNLPWGEYFNGLIDEVRVYNRALAASEIQGDMNAAVAGGAPGGFVSAMAPVSAPVMSSDSPGAGASILTGTVTTAEEHKRQKHNRRNHRRDRLRLGDEGAVRAVKHRRGPAYAFVAGLTGG
jgi:hypothetical protein